MTPSVAASTTVVTAALLAGVSTAVHDREWWSEEAVHVGTDWYGVVEAAFKRLIAAGIIEPPAAETRTLWDTPPWHDAALEYHRNRPGCLAVEIEPKRLARLRRLMADDVSLGRAWHELRDNYGISKANFRKGFSDDGRN
jgi:hypothetical protein